MTPITERTNGHTRDKVGFDELTGVWNRAGFVAAATPMFVACQRRDVPLALAYFDLAYGDAGSVENLTRPAVLVATAEQLRKTFRASDIVGRLDVYRFAVLLADCSDSMIAAVEGMRAITEQSSSSEGLTLATGVVRNSAGETLDRLMRATDLRMREIKGDQTHP